MIEDTLGGAKSKRYRHAVRHPAECQSLASLISDYGQFETHAGFLARLRAGHGRKPTQPQPATSLIKAVEGTTYGLADNASSPKLWMFFDPQCSFSVRAFQQLQPLVASGRVQLAIIPVSILDHEDGGLSTKTALSLLSLPPDQIAGAWCWPGDVRAIPGCCRQAAGEHGRLESDPAARNPYLCLAQPGWHRRPARWHQR